MRFIFLLFILSFSLGYQDLFAQIYAPEGLNMPGAWNGWTNPPTNVPALGGVQVTGGKVLVDTTLPLRRYRTIIYVKSTGGDITPGTYNWLFTSGPSGSPWNNKWAAVNVVMDTVQSYTYNSGADNSISVQDNYYYNVSYRDAGYTGTQAIFMKTSAVPVAIDSVYGFNSVVAQNTPVTVSVKLHAAACAEEKFYLRYSTDNFATSSVIPVTNFDVGTHVGTATIPGQGTAGTTVKFYVLSTTVSSSSWGSNNIDLMTLNMKRNGTVNFSYDVQPITSVGVGNWTNPAIWNTGIVPSSGANVTINTNVTVNTNITVSSLTINSGSTLYASDATPRTLTVSSGGSITNNGTFTHQNGTVTFTGTGSVTGTVGFYNVNLNDGVNFGSASTIYGTMLLNTGAWCNTNAPSYASGSTLQYSTGGTYGRWLEWSDTTGKGYPANVRISNGTVVDLGNSGASITRRISGSLTIDSLCALTMDTLGNSMTAPLKVLGSVTNYGRLILSSNATGGGDLYVAGNFTNYGLFNSMDREANFNGTSQQTINLSANSTTYFDFVAISNPAGVSLGNAPANKVNINKRLRFTSGAGNLLTNSDTLTFSLNSAWLENETSSHYVVGILRISRSVGTSGNDMGGVGAQLIGTSDLGDVTVTRYSGTVGQVTVGSNSGINRKWKISTTVTEPFTSRQLVLYWNSADDNGRSLTNSQVYKSTNDGATWATATGYLNSPSRGDTVSVTSFGWFTISDSAHPLTPTSFTLSVTALIEGLWNGTTSVTDTIQLECHSQNAPYAVIASGKAVCSNAGVTSVSLNGLTNGTPYYIVVTHRNSIETWSMNPQTFSSNALSYNFTTAATQAFGSNLNLVSGKYCIYSGDVNVDGIVDFSDLSMIDNDSFLYTTGYVSTDLNGDQFVDFTDLVLCDNNSYNYVAVAKPGSKAVKHLRINTK